MRSMNLNTGVCQSTDRVVGVSYYNLISVTHLLELLEGDYNVLVSSGVMAPVSQEQSSSEE